MENTLAILETKKTEIKKLFAPTLTDLEFEYFMQLAISLKANPFNREIYAIKYQDKLNIMCGRDLYRRVAQEQESYERHIAVSIYENDSFTFENGVPKHSFSLKNRGNILGAYACLWKKGVANPFFVLVYFREYEQKFGLWKSSPNTMICKVAESQVLRMAYQGIFAGTYNESEQWKEETIETDYKEVKIANPAPTKQADKQASKEETAKVVVELASKEETEKLIEWINASPLNDEKKTSYIEWVNKGVTSKQIESFKSKVETQINS